MYVVIPTSPDGISLTLSQEAKRQAEQLEHKKKEEEKARGEKLEVCYNPHIFWKNDSLTPSQEEKRRKELEHKETGESKTKLEVHHCPHLF